MSDETKLYFTPTRALLDEAEAQKVRRIRRLEQQLEAERAEPALANAQELEFTEGHPNWPALRGLAERTFPSGGPPEFVRIMPYPWKQEWAWRISTGRWEGYVNHEQVLACFKDEPETSSEGT